MHLDLARFRASIAWNVSPVIGSVSQTNIRTCSWHETMQQREKNPFLALKEHPRWKFVEEVEVQI
jgi:hypothetical protein